MMIDIKTIETPSTHYGNGKHATRGFIMQRLTGALSILFVGFFIWLVVRLAGADRAEMVAVVAHPLVALLLALLLVVVAIHMRIGMLEVIDDYITEPGLYRTCNAANTAFAVLIVLIGVGAIAKLVFWG